MEGHDFSVKTLKTQIVFQTLFSFSILILPGNVHAGISDFETEHDA